MAERRLTPRMAMFCQEYLIDTNGAGAARRAGYSESGVRTQASRLLGFPQVKAEIDRLMEKRMTEINVEANRVLEELAAIGFSNVTSILNDKGQLTDPALWPKDVSAAISRFEIVKTDEDGRATHWKVSFWDKNAALEKMGRHMNMFSETIEHTVFNVSFSDDDASVL